MKPAAGWSASYTNITHAMAVVTVALAVLWLIGLGASDRAEAAEGCTSNYVPACRQTLPSSHLRCNGSTSSHLFPKEVRDEVL